MVNEVSSQHTANPALYSATAGQRPPPQLRTETPPETQRPVPPTQGTRAQGADDQLSISQQARSRAADDDGDNDNDSGNAEAAQADARGNTAGPESRSGSSPGIEKYNAVKAMIHS